ncbi:MAG TPA: dTMP kinase [Ktedonobacteraceae bacterium]|nr:dTMP kinase [Ktedonobacteraceae bacterium]
MARDQEQASKQTALMIYPERPRLIVLEGIDLSGRTTQVQLLLDWLVAQHYHVTTTAWRTSPLISDLLARARTATPLRPLSYSMLYAADHIDRTQHIIRPALERGGIVLADRYLYTALARDTARGLDPAWVQNLYRNSVQPDAVFYLHIGPEEAVKRRLSLQQQRLGELHVGKHKSAKIDKDGKNGKEHKQRKQEKEAKVATSVQSPALTGEALESFRNFEVKMYSAYQQMQKAYAFTVIEGNQPIDQVQATLRRAIMRLLLEI